MFQNVLGEDPIRQQFLKPGVLLFNSLVRFDASAFISDPYWYSLQHQSRLCDLKFLDPSTTEWPPPSIFWP